MCYFDSQTGMLATRYFSIGAFFIFYGLYLVALAIKEFTLLKEMKTKLTHFLNHMSRSHFFFMIIILVGHMAANPGVVALSYFYALASGIVLVGYILNAKLWFLTMAGVGIQILLYFVMLLILLIDTWCEYLFFKFYMSSDKDNTTDYNALAAVIGWGSSNSTTSA